ncbi:MAG: hypothetical protein KME30_33465 [Iphinoe sp. HA4291-MV1]|jgi:hypothetical protein|nr:hypothetical protein [Iphinoe sp. HA4291-MV1]
MFNIISIAKIHTIALVLITITALFINIKPISADTYSPKLVDNKLHNSLAIGDNFSNLFSTKASDLLINSQNDRLNIELSKYQDAKIEIGERSCSVEPALWQIKIGNKTLVTPIDSSIYIADRPIEIITFFTSTPTNRIQSVKLESKQTILPSSNKICNDTLSYTVEEHYELSRLGNRTLMQQLTHHPELELNIQKLWNMLNLQD